MEGIEKLEAATEKADGDIDIDKMLTEYRQLYPTPIWRLIEDVERQAMLYANIIEQIKSGQTAEAIRTRFNNLGILPGAELPNPSVPALLEKALDKISRYRKALVDIVKKYGGELLNELSFELERTVSVSVNIGFPPSVSIGVEHTARITSVTKF
jgi:hypothetical protein